MKKLRIAKLITWILALVFYFVTIIVFWIESFTIFAMLIYFLSSCSCVAFAAVGIVLLQSLQTTPRKIGHVATVFSILSTMGFACLMAEKTEYFAMLICSAVCLMASYVLCVLEIVQSKMGNPVTNKAFRAANKKVASMLASDTERIARIREWKQLLDEGILTPEEFAEKKTEILGMAPKEPPV